MTKSSSSHDGDLLILKAVLKESRAVGEEEIRVQIQDFCGHLL